MTLIVRLRSQRGLLGLVTTSVNEVLKPFMCILDESTDEKCRVVGGRRMSTDKDNEANHCKFPLFLEEHCCALCGPSGVRGTRFAFSIFVSISFKRVSSLLSTFIHLAVICSG